MAHEFENTRGNAFCLHNPSCYLVYHVNTLDYCDSACRCGNPKRHASKHNSSWTDSLMLL